jgi:acyl-homoserine-lactone acylase
MERDARAASATRILWDKYGVPHIVAPSDPELFYAFAWAQMESHAEILLRLVAKARGRAAEMWGEEFVESDHWVRSNQIRRRSELWMSRQEPSFALNIEEFANGITEYCAAHEREMPSFATDLLPVTAIDILSHVQRIIYYTFLTDETFMKRRCGQTDDVRGSNAWAVAPNRSKSGRSLLLTNPHLPWTEDCRLYEAQLETNNINGHGVALLGFPVLGIAFNEHLGWTLTVNPHCATDLYKCVRVDDKCIINGVEYTVDRHCETVLVMQDDGECTSHIITVEMTELGPILTREDGELEIMRISGVSEPGLLKQWWDMLACRSMAEFELVLGRLQMPLFTVVYADHEGNILSVFNGRIPIRVGNDKREAVTPWAARTTDVWQGVHSYQELPRIHNPATGWLQNCNDPPWNMTHPSPIDPDEFPSYFAPRGMNLRAQWSCRLLEARGNLTLEDLVRLKFSSRVMLADRVLDEVLAAGAYSANPAVATAIPVLKSWDRCTKPNSRGAVLFESFVEKWCGDGGLESVCNEPWSEEAPLDTPRGLKNPERAIVALAEATIEVAHRYGAADVAWGDVYQIRVPGHVCAANGGPGDPFGIFCALRFCPDSGVAVAGEAYCAIIEFSKPIRARTLLLYGNSSCGSHPVYCDQLELFAKRKMKSVSLLRADVERRAICETRIARRPDERNEPTTSSECYP